MNIVSSHTVRMNQNILSGGRKIFVPLLKINLFKPGNDAGLNSRLYTHSENIADLKKKRQFWSKT